MKNSFSFLCTIIPLLIVLLFGAIIPARAEDYDECTAYKLPKAASTPHHRVALCTMVQNEGRYILEWIEYHRLIGVDHFIIYNDRGTDNTPSLLKPYIDAGIVSLHYWDNNVTVDTSLVSEAPAYTRNQRFSLADCVYNKGHLADWIGIWDVDEFLYIWNKDYKTVNDVIENYVKPNGWTNMHIPATNFGPSGHVQRPTGLVMDNYRWRSGVVAFGAIDGKTQGFSGKSLYTSRCAMPEVHHSPFPPSGCINGVWPHIVEDGGIRKLPLYPVMIKHYKYKSFEDSTEKIRKWFGGSSLGDYTWEKFAAEHKTESEFYDLDMLQYVKDISMSIKCNQVI